MYYTDARVDARLPTSILNLNISDGTADHYLQTDGAGTFSFTDPLANASIITGPGQLQLNPSPEGGGSLGDVRINGRLTVANLARFNGNMEFGNNVSDTITITARYGSHLVSQIETGDTPIYDIGEYNRTWRDGFFQGVTTVTLNSLNFPTSDGTAGHALTTDGAGTLSFTNILNTGSLTDLGDVNSPGSTTPGNIMVVHASGTEYAWIPERKVLDDLNDINAGSPSDGQVLTWNNASSKWIPTTVSSGGGGATTLDGLTDTNIGTPSDGQALVYDSGTTSWIAGTISGYTDAQADARIAAASIADLNDVTGTTTDGDILTYNASTSSYEFQAGFSLTVPSTSSESINGEVLEWDFGNNEFVIKDLYDLSTSQRISREETATQVIYRFN